MSVGLVEEEVGVVELDQAARVHHHDAVGVHDGVEAVRHRQHGALREARPYCSLDKFIRSGNENSINYVRT